MKKKKKFFDDDWWKDLIVAVTATTISIILTFGTARLVERHQRNNDRRMTAMMVISNIESFARNMEDMEKRLARRDSIATWLITLGEEDIDLLPGDLLGDMLTDVMMLETIQYDKTAETIFSSNTDTWRNLGNYRFVENVGTCFSVMKWIESYWNGLVTEQIETFDRIIKTPDAFEGKNNIEKMLRDKAVRLKLMLLHNSREWFMNNTAEIRRINSENMQLFNISEQQVKAFTDARQYELQTEESSHRELFPRLELDSLSSIQPYRQLLDSLRQASRKH
ncbi:MAG: hypothetical protein IJR64_00965 [Bacteroidales bacterium]|nr:hypothetical protein [Bacteroidales bacterium]